MIRLIVSLSSIVVVIYAALEKRQLSPIPKELAHKHGCYEMEVEDVIPFGESIAPVGTCTKVHCWQDARGYETCDPVKISDPKCYATEIDYSRPYPACCPLVQCDISVSVQ